MYINIIELLEAIKDACTKNDRCKDCPFSGYYKHTEDGAAYNNCKIGDTPAGWQIDSARDAEVLCDVSDFEKYYNMVD